VAVCILPTLRQRFLSSKLYTTQRWLLLSIIGGLSWLVYQIGLLRPYSFSALGIQPLLDIAKLTRGQPIGQASYVLTIAVSFGLYGLAYWLCRNQRSRSMWLVLAAIVIAIGIALIQLYPIGAADIFDSLVHGRLTSHYGVNPFYVAPDTFRDDPFFAYVGWSNTTSTYGPLFEWITAGVTRLAGDDVLANVLLFKWVLFAFYAGSVILIGWLLRRRDPDRALQGVCLFALNPLVLYMTLGNGHNDILMVFFIALGAVALVQGRYTIAALAFTTGGAIKFISIALIPIALVLGLRDNRSWRARIKFLIVTGFMCAVVIAISLYPFYNGGDFFGFKWKFILYTTSLPSVAQAALQDSIGLDASRLLVNRASLILLAIVVLVQTWRAYRSHDWRATLRAALIILLFYLLMSVAWFQPWYIEWALILAAMLVGSGLARLTLLLSYSVMWKSIFIDYYLYNGYWIDARAPRELLTIIVIFGVVWVYGAYLIGRRIFGRADSSQRSSAPEVP
jgi:alpha-1,6-mannosyltransferase